MSKTRVETKHFDKEKQKWIYFNHVDPNYPDQIWNTREDGSLDVATIVKGPSLTQQQFKDECDINNILRSYTETGTINHINRKNHLYGDFSDIPNFQESLDIVRYAEEQFMLLPAKVRARFENDPAQLVAFCNDPNNMQEAIELGLADAPKTVSNVNNDQTTNTNKTVKKGASNPSDAVSPASKNNSEE